MKKLFTVLGMLLVATCAWSQMPIFRNAFTTNVPGAYVRGNLDFGTPANWARFNGRLTNGTGISVSTGPVQAVEGTAAAYFGFDVFDRYMPFVGGAGFLVSAGSLTFAIDSNNDQTDRIFKIERNSNVGSGDELMRVQEDGRVGIRTNAPGYTLDVHGAIQSTNFHLLVPQWDDLRLPMSTLSSPSSQPGRVTFKGNLLVYGFDDASTEQLAFEMQLPHGIATNAQYGIRLHIHWTCLSAIAGANSNVVWGIEYSMANVGEVFPTLSITNLITNAVPAPFSHQMASFAPITNGFRESAVIVGRVFREGGNGGDTLAQDAVGLSLDAHYPRLQMGSVSPSGDF